jgi:hypothetical protein
MAVVGGLLSAGMGIMQGVYQSQVASNNAKIARWNANAAIQRSQVEAYDSDMKNRGLEGEIVSSQGASGLALTGASAERTRSTAAKLARQDALRIRYAGDVEAWNYNAQSKQFEAQSQMSLLGGFAEGIGGLAQAYSSLTSQSSSVSNKWAWMQE